MTVQEREQCIDEQRKQRMRRLENGYRRLMRHVQVKFDVYYG